MNNERDEARCLAQFVTRGLEPADQIRDLIRISPSDAEILRSSLHPELLQSLIEYRNAVLREFERLIQPSRPVATRRDRKVAFILGCSKGLKARTLKIAKQQNQHSVGR